MVVPLMKKALTTSSLSTTNNTTMGKGTALCNKNAPPKSDEVINSVLDCQLHLPCPTRWNSYYDSLAMLT